MGGAASEKKENAMAVGTEQSYTKFFCVNCGKWIGVFDNRYSLDGVYPYCSRCKQAVSVTDKYSYSGKLNVYQK